MTISEQISQLPEGLSYAEAARQLGRDYQAVRLAMIRLKYKTTDGRSTSQSARKILDPDKIDWSKGDTEIARDLLATTGKKISKQRVNAVRKELGLRKPEKEARGRPRSKPDGERPF